MVLHHGGEDISQEVWIEDPHAKDLDFSENTSPFGPPASVLAAFHASARAVAHYPDSWCTAFCRQVAFVEGVPSPCVVAGNGSLEILDAAFRAIKPQRVLLVDPSFGEYRHLAHLHGCEVVAAPLCEAAGFAFSLDALLAALPGCDMVILGHPNNPTGTALASRDLRSLARAAAAEGAFLVIDEAFIDFWPQGAFHHDLAEETRVLILRSLTKFYGLAGIRIGYGLAPPAWARRFWDAKLTWSVNALAQVLGRAALADDAFRCRQLEWLYGEKAWFVNASAGLKSWSVVPSRANFYLLKGTDDASVQEAVQGLRQKGIFVRTCVDFQGLGARYIRVALKQRAQNQALLDALAERESAVPAHEHIS